MTMATQHKLESRGSKSGMLRKQTEIEETEEQDTSPGSDQSDATITASGEGQTTQSSGGGSPGSGGSRCDSQSEENHTNNHNQVNPKVKQLIRSQAFEDMSPPPEQNIVLVENTNGIYLKSQGRNGLEKSNSQSSEAGTSSSLSRESSFDHPYKDSTGINLEDFIHKTLNKTPKDRNMLLKLETDLTNFINEPKHHYLKFPQMSSYDRMLVHRIAAFFGLDHNVDQTGKCVIVNKTSNTRVPDFCFQEHIDAVVDHKGKPKVIMKRHGISLDEKESHSKHDRLQLHQMREVRSLEERQKQYESARRKIFSRSEESEILQPLPFSKDQGDEVGMILKKPSRPCSLSTSSDGHTWSSTESSGYGTDNSSKSRGIPKANSFGGLTSSYTNHHIKSPHKSQSFNKQDSISSGASSSMGSPMTRQLPPAPTPPGRSSGSSPLSRSSSSGPVQSPVTQGFVTGQGQQVFWVASDIRNVPPGSVIINPQTGQPMSNPDGSVYHHNPGQQVPSHPPQPQPTVFTQQFSTEEAHGQLDLCQHLSRMTVNQPSIDNMGEAPPGATPTAPIANNPYILGATTQPHPNLQPGFSQQHPNQVVQGQVFQGQQNMTGQPVRYVYPVNYSVQTPSGQNQQATVSMETPTQTFNPNMGQFPTQYTPSYPNYQQGGTAPGQSIDNFSATNFSQSTYPTPQGDSNVTGYTSYPVQYSQNSFGGQNSSTVFYSTVPASNPQLGLSYGGQQQVFNSSTPPSQSNATNPTVAIHNIPAAAQQPVNVGQPPTGNTPTATTPQYMYPTMPQFGGQPRSTNPQLVQFHNVQGHNPTQTIPLIRNMQFNMQIPTQAPGIHGPTTAGGGGAGVAGQPSQVTISAAKAFSMDNQVPKIESSADNKDFGIGSLGSPLVAGPPRPPGQLYRPPAPITSQDMRFLGQTQFRPSLQPVQYHSAYPQPQKQRPYSMQTNSVPKPQRIKKSRSKDGSQSSQSSLDSGDVVNSGNTLEVYDLPSNMNRSEADKLLSDLVCAGAQLQYVFNDTVTTDTAVDNMTVSDLKQVLAIFPNVTSASQTLQNHSNARYKLRVAMTTQSTLPPDNIGGGRC